MSGDDGDDDRGLSAWHWVENVGKPLWHDVQALKQAAWTIGGGGAVAGAILTMLGGVILKKLGLS